MKKLIFTTLIIVLFLTNYSQNFRDSVDVIHYKINLTIDDFSEKKIEGYTQITCKPIFNQTKSIKFDLLDLNVEKIYVDEKKFTKWTYNDSVVSLNFKTPIDTNEIKNITVYYSGQPEEDSYWGGFYFSTNNAYNMGVGMNSTPHSFGRVWFPCIDNFTDKATYTFIIKVDEDYEAVCGGINTPVKLYPEGFAIYRWEMKNPIPTYLASVSVANYEVLKQTYEGIERNIPIEIYTFTGKKSLAEKSLINLHKTLNVYENLFGAYSWDKIGYSEVNFPSGAMEHAENISITNYAFNGSLSGETLIYHELSHSWFGNLVTCKTASDMWLNEGWASYCESIFMENIYGTQKFRDYNRNRHFEVIHLAHQKDHGYRAVANMDINYTYGTTVYEKGAEVIHTLRFYMQDSLFFPAVRHYLSKFAFKTASTEDFKNALSEYSKINLDDFFDFWVYDKGFNFFEINSYNIIQNNQNFDVTVKVGQRLIETENYANSNKIEISFMDSSFNIIHKIYEFSGKEGKQTFSIPFKPALIMLDMYEKTADATVDKYTFIAENGVFMFDECLFDAEVYQMSDTSFLRVVCNCIEPQNIEMPGYLFQKNYYWTIEGIWNNDFKAKGKFYLTTLMDLNFTKLYKAKNFILMYRKDNTEKWQQVDFEHHSDYLQTDLKKGQYAIAVKTYE